MLVFKVCYEEEAELVVVLREELLFESDVVDAEVMVVVGKLCLVIPRDKILVCGYTDKVYVPLKVQLVLFELANRRSSGPV